MEKKVCLSVLMTTYRGDNSSFLSDAIASVWCNQLDRPSQIVVVKDGLLSKDLDDVILYWEEKLCGVLTVVSLPENIGLAKALNEGLRYCRYDLVARMDSDDVALPNRFQKQFWFMSKHSEIVASSAWVAEYSEDMSACHAVRKVPEAHCDIMKFCKTRSPMNHPAVIFRKNVVQDLGGYPSFRKSQDLALWSKLIVSGHKLANIPEVLLRMRTGDEFYTRRGMKHFFQELRVIKYQKSIGLINSYELCISVSIRFVARVLPSFLRKLMYRFIR
ncbi:glycosyltransferase [Halomonas cupida]|uniref:glycosyltransferase n=1 Tax=Halomonas cupida TaxID=44933 RepID=UPI003EF72779